jgi:hypothetical protein
VRTVACIWKSDACNIVVRLPEMRGSFGVSSLGWEGDIKIDLTEVGCEESVTLNCIRIWFIGRLL